MKITQLEKDIDTVVNLALDDSVLFVEYQTIVLKNGSRINKLFSKTISKMTMEELKKYISNPKVAIVRIEL